LLVDDHSLVRAGFRRILEASQEFEVCGEAADGHEAVRLAKSLKPDLVLMDISLPLLSGIEATRQIVKAVPDSSVIILSQHESSKFIEVALREGALGYLLKTAEPEDLLEALRAARDGKCVLSPEIAKSVVDALARDSREELPYDRLTGREREVLQLIAEGFSNKQVADQLGIATRTAETHRANIMAKLGVHNLAVLVRFAIREGLVDS
jgi:DNA-binding NarL/FixJ family response regulator